MEGEPLHRALGLTDDEASAIVALLGREPNELELAMYSVMWSEHCSYKSSRRHLSRLPTEAPWVLVGPGENAGVIDVGDGIAVAMRIESHNHPSAIEPYQGAATGIGGIIRDIFTMGARPIALMDPLRFGPLDDPRSRWIAEGVVRGISGYGNSVGVPTVGGEVVFDPTYTDNPLVNVFCLGTLPVERLVLGQASGVGNLAVLLGAPTGRDGIGGVSVLASAGFDEGDEQKRPSVQVGDPYEEKRLIEACLELLDAGLVTGIQDLGGAGLTCATSETASRGGVGMDVDVTAVPTREGEMSPVEIMTSESQERMLAIIEPTDLAAVESLCHRWEVRASVVGRVTEGGELRVLDGFDGEMLASVPASTLHDDAPVYDRPMRAQAGGGTDPASVPDTDLGEDLTEFVADLSWVWTQYDHQLFLNTVLGPGHDAAVLTLKHPVTGERTGRGLALTTDGNHRWCAVDPRRGTANVVAEAMLNIATAAATPMALVNCLNFGNPEHPEVMWQLSEAIDGMAEACRAFGIPVIGGNVSLYNESAGTDIDPTPIVAVLGMLDTLEVPPCGSAMADGDRVLLIGDGAVSLAGSRWAFRNGARGGRLAELDVESHLAVCATVREIVRERLVTGVGDVSDGGIGGTVAEMAARAGVGVSLARLRDRVELFGEGPSRVIASVAADRVVDVESVAAAHGVTVTRLGLVTGDRFCVKGLLDLSMRELAERWRRRLPDALGSGVATA